MLFYASVTADNTISYIQPSACDISEKTLIFNEAQLLHCRCAKQNRGPLIYSL